MSTVDKRVREAVSKIVKESGVSEPAVLKVIEAIKNTDAVAVAIILDLANNEDTESIMGDEIDTGSDETDATFEDGAGDDTPDAVKNDTFKS